MSEVKMMKALYHRAAGRPNAHIEMIPYPTCGDNDVIMKVMSCSICKWADINHDTVGGGGTLAKYPVVTGHEFAGIVEEVGKNVTDFKPGDHITADNAIPCGHCHYCKNGKPLLCENFGSLGHNINGGYAQYLVVTQNNVVKLPENLPFDQACIAEPVACAIEAIDRADIKAGENVVISGMGPHGIILAQLATHSNAMHALAVGLVEERLAILREHGCETVLADRNDMSVQEKAIREICPDGIDVIIDTSGAWNSLMSLYGMLKKGGRILQYGAFHRAIDLPDPAGFFNELHFKNQSWIGVSCQVHNFPRAVEYMKTGKVDVSMLVTHTFDLDDYFLALDTNKTDKSAQKVVIHPNGDPNKQ